jgi:hypothetical protein
MFQRPRDDSTRQEISVECPLCNKTHAYDAQVTESGVMYYTAPPPRAFTRLFTCPTTGGTFQAEIVMSGGVSDVLISGLHEAEANTAEEDNS